MPPVLPRGQYTSKWYGISDRLPRTWYINSNPFNSCVCRAIHDVVLKVAGDGPSVSAKYCRIEHNSRIGLYETKGVCESMDMEISQHKTRQPNAGGSMSPHVSSSIDMNGSNQSKGRKQSTQAGRLNKRNVLTNSPSKHQSDSFQSKLGS